jgi:hypothetical protein
MSPHFQTSFRCLPPHAVGAAAESIDLFVCGADQQDHADVFRAVRRGGYVVCDAGGEDVAAALAAAGFQAIVYRTALPGADEEQAVIIAQKSALLTLGRLPG